MVLVVGGREFSRPYIVYDKLSEIEPSMVVQGGESRGVELYARRWCQKRGVPCVTMHDYDGTRQYFDAFDVAWVLAFPRGVEVDRVIGQAAERGVAVIKCHIEGAPEYLLDARPKA